MRLMRRLYTRLVSVQCCRYAKVSKLPSTTLQTQHVKPIYTPKTTQTADIRLKCFNILYGNGNVQDYRPVLLIALAVTLFTMAAAVRLGEPRRSRKGFELEDEFTHMPFLKQRAYRALSELHYYAQFLVEPTREKLLPDKTITFQHNPQYTLVLEFTDVMVSCDWTWKTGWRYKMRPGLDYLLEKLGGTFEIVVYTAEKAQAVYPVLEIVDPNDRINYTLVRDATVVKGDEHVKDLGRLNRDLGKTIVIDWNDESTVEHGENVFVVKRWAGNDDDLTLIHLTSFLLAIAQNQVQDVREVITHYNKFADPLGTFRRKQKSIVDLAELAASDDVPDVEESNECMDYEWDSPVNWIFLSNQRFT